MGEGESAFGRDIWTERERLGDSDDDSMRKREAWWFREKQRSLAVMEREREREGMRELKPCEERPHAKYQWEFQR